MNSPSTVPESRPVMSADVPFAYAGTYAPEGRGIYALVIGRDGGCQARLAVELPGSPSWLHLSGDGRVLHALLEERHEIVSFDVDSRSGVLTERGRCSTGGLHPVHLCESDASLWIAHYGDGALMRLSLDQGLPRAIDARRPAPVAAGPTHAHMVRRHPRRPWLVATDLGRDELRVWSSDVSAATPIGRLMLPPGSGPRHFQWHPHDPAQLYLLNEQANALDWIVLDDEGRPALRERTSSLPDGFQGLSYASDLLVAPDARHLLGLNRLHDSIVVWRLEADGRPRRIGEVWARGSYPRSAAVSPDGRELWVCQQRSHQLCVFDLAPSEEGDADAGAALPRFSGRFVALPGAACVVWR